MLSETDRNGLIYMSKAKHDKEDRQREISRFITLVLDQDEQISMSPSMANHVKGVLRAQMILISLGMSAFCMLLSLFTVLLLFGGSYIYGQHEIVVSALRNFIEFTDRLGLDRAFSLIALFWSIYTSVGLCICEYIYRYSVARLIKIVN